MLIIQGEKHILQELVSVRVRVSLEIITGFSEHLGKGPTQKSAEAGGNAEE